MSFSIAPTVAIVSTRVLQRTGPRPLVPAGLLTAALGMVLLTRIGVDTAYATHVLPSLVLIGIGFGLTIAPAFATATHGVPPQDAGVASAMVNTSQQIGGSIGTALLSTVAASVGGVEGYTTAFWWAAGLYVAGALVCGALLRARHAAGAGARPGRARRDVRRHTVARRPRPPGYGDERRIAGQLVDERPLAARLHRRRRADRARRRAPQPGQAAAPMKIVVTTPTGKVGSRVVRLLLQAGVRPTLLLRDPAKLDPRTAQLVDAVAGDQFVAGDVLRATEGADALYLVCPPVHEGDPVEAYARAGAIAARAVGSTRSARVVFRAASARSSARAWARSTASRAPRSTSMQPEPPSRTCAAATSSPTC